MSVAEMSGVVPEALRARGGRSAPLEGELSGWGERLRLAKGRGGVLTPTADVVDAGS